MKNQAGIAQNVWIILVCVLAAIALLIWILTHVTVAPHA
jgi:hypothetical protein